MYPRLGDLIYGIFGIQLKVPVQTFGFFVALAFVGAFLVIRRELKRKEKLGHYQLRTIQTAVEGPIPITELILPSLIWGLVGYKVGYAFVDYEMFYQHTQDVILSSKGWWLTGLLGLLGYGIPRFLQWKKSQGVPMKLVEEQVGPSYYMNLVLTMAFFAGILGAKIATYAENWSAFAQDPWGAIFSFDGLAWYGGLLLAAFVICYFFYRKGYNVLACIDGFTPGLIVGYGIGRMGCHFAGDGDWGIVNTHARPGFLSWLPDWAWAYDYPHNVVNEGIPIPGCSGPFCNHLAQPAWPTPLYEVLMALAIFGILLLVRKHLPVAGQLTGVYMILIGVERMLIEQIRVNDEYLFLGIQFTQAEMISFLMIAGGALLWYRVSRRAKLQPRDAG